MALEILFLEGGYIGLFSHCYVKARDRNNLIEEFSFDSQFMK